MKIICALTDKGILGTSSLSSAPQRKTTRAIIKNTDDLFAVLYITKYDLYCLPAVELIAVKL